MNKEEWLINEVDKWQEDSIIDSVAGEKIKKQYELYRNYNPNIFAILFAILGAVLMVAGAGIAAFYTWPKMTGVTKTIVAVSPLVLSYVLSIYTILFKTDNKIWKESSAFLNVVSMFGALGAIILSFHLRMSLSQYLIISSALTIPVLYIMQAVSPLIIYYGAVLAWGSLNISGTNAAILLLLFLLGVGLIAFNIKTLNKTLKYNVTVCAIAGLPFMVLFVKMLKGDAILAMLLYSTLLFAARDIRRHYFPFKLISMVVSLITIVSMTTSQAWAPIDGKYGGIILGIITGLILLASLSLEVFNTQENNYEFSYLLILMGSSIIRYIWGCIQTDDIVLQMVFMGVGIVLALLVALGFVSLGKLNKKMETSMTGFIILGILILIKIFETNIFFLGRALGFLGLGCISLIMVILLSSKNNSEENNETQTKIENTSQETEEVDDGGQEDEEDNIIS